MKVPRLMSGGSKRGHWVRGIVMSAMLMSQVTAFAASERVASLDERRLTDKLLTVDCLLPGQVRQLGTSMTYLTPRRPIKTSAGDCEVRGGEYVAYDRSSYGAALRIWLPAAEKGDHEAETNVGEIYERGVAGVPDFEKAAYWYRKAADAGYGRAMINLGFLYEQGRGVPQDPATALQLYRKAAGFVGSVNLEAPPSSASQEEVDALRKELERTRQELEKARRELDQERIKAGAEIERLTQAKLAAAARGNTEETRRLEALLKERETELEKRRQQVARFEQSAEENKQRLTRLEGESASMRQDLERARIELAQSQRVIEEKRDMAGKQERQLESLRTELARQKQAGPAIDPARIGSLEAELATRNEELARQKQELSRLEKDNAGFKEKVARLDRVEGETASLRQQVEQARQQLAESQRELQEKQAIAARRERESDSMRAELVRQKQAGPAIDPTRIKTLENELAKRDEELARQKQELSRLEKDNAGFKEKVARLDRAEGETVSLRRQVDEAKQQLAQSQREFQEKQATAARQERELDSMRAELARQKQAGPAIDPARVRSLEAELAKRDEELARQKQDLSRLEKDNVGFKEKVARLEKPARPAVMVDVAPPSIQILDPSIVVTRNTAAVKVRAGLTTRPVVGHVVAPAGLVSFTANDVAQQVDPDGFFTSNVTLGPGRTRVTMIAIDRQSKRAVVEFFLEQPTAESVVAAPKADVPGLNLGNFHALLIGDQRYRNLRPLNSPESDVTEIGALLRDRYGFKVTTLVDATRYQILTEMNRLMETLTERDNLLIYYAGHGEIDPSTQNASWLPIDADPKNDSNWISSDDLTRKITPMKARHVLVVSDSCYSGVLTRSSVSQAKPGATEEERIEWMKTVAAKKSRHLLSSGGRAPVMDGGGGKHSVFAAVFIDALTANDDVLDGRHLGLEVSARVLAKSRDQKFGEGQLPDYRPIQYADNDGGEFLFPKPKPRASAVSLEATPPIRTSRSELSALR